jgi:hypothetical protein
LPLQGSAWKNRAVQITTTGVIQYFRVVMVYWLLAFAIFCPVHGWTGLGGGILSYYFGIIPAMAVANESPRRTKNLPLPR